MKRLVIAALVALGTASVALAMPRGTVFVKRTGQRFDDVEWEVKGELVEVKFGIGSRTWSVNEVILVPAEESTPRDGEGAEVEDEEEEPRTTDWTARARLARPDGWQAVSSAKPLVRLQLLRPSDGTTISISLGPSRERWELGDQGVPRELGNRVGEDLAMRYSGVRSPSLGRGTFMGETVLSVDKLGVQELGSDQRRVVSERRFQRFGFDYALTVSVAPGNEAVLAQTDALLSNSFSFLAPTHQTRSSYSDYELGFSVTRPSEDWTVESHPFEADQPVRLALSDGRAEFKVTVVAKGGDASSWVRDMLDRRRKASRYFEQERVESGQLDGVTVERFYFEDFPEGGRKKMRFNGFAAPVQGRLIVATGMSPLTDDDATKLKDEVSRILSTFRLYDPTALGRLLDRERDALARLQAGYAALLAKKSAEALSSLDEAVSLAPHYAQAYYLRALAKKQSGDFVGFQRDVEQAAEMDPESGYDRELVTGYVEEAAALQRDGRHREAYDRWLRAYRSTKSPQHLQGLVKCMEEIWKPQLEANPHVGIGEMEDLCKDLMEQDLVKTFLAKAYTDAANKLSSRGRFAQAKRWAGRLKRLDDRYRTQADQLLNSIKQAEERAKQQRR